MAHTTRSNLCSRRTCLYLIATPALAGCFGDNEVPPGLGKISIVNGHERTIEASVTVLKDGETVYDRTHQIDGFEANVWGGASLVESWMGDRARYEVQIEVPSIGTDTHSTEDFSRMFDGGNDAPCYKLTAGIEEEDIVFYVGLQDQCPEETR